MGDLSEEELAKIERDFLRLEEEAVIQAEAAERKAQADREERLLQQQLAQVASLAQEERKKVDEEERQFQLQLARSIQLAQEEEKKRKEAEDRTMAMYLAQIAKLEQEEAQQRQRRAQMEAKERQDSIARLAMQLEAVATDEKKRLQNQKSVQSDVDDMIAALSLLHVTPPPPSSAKKPQQVPGKMVSFCGPLPWVSIMTRKGWAAAQQLEFRPNLQNVCVRECGGEGDCLFYALGTAYAMSENRLLSPQQNYEQMLQVRKWLAESLTTRNIEDFLHQAQQEKFTSQENVKRNIPGFWPTDAATWKPDSYGSTRDLKYDIPGTSRLERIPGTDRNRHVMGQQITYRYPFPPHMARKLDINHPNFEFYPGFVKPPGLSERDARILARNKILLAAVRQDVRTPGWTYPGDSDTLKYIVQSPQFRTKNLGVLVIEDVDPKDLKENKYYTGVDCFVYPFDEPRDRYIFLFHLRGHWQLAGYAVANNAVQVIFPRQEIPYVLRKLYKDKCGGIPGNLYELTPDEDEERKEDEAR